MGDNQPPATHYHLGDEDGSFYAEFLTPLIGSEFDRKGNRRATTKVAGITSQSLRHVDILLRAPWSVELSAANGFPFQEPKNIQLANPTHFMAQKLLIHDRRERRSRAKDILYLHDTIELFGGSLEVLKQEWITNAKPALSEKAIRSVENAADLLFADLTDDVRNAAQAAAGRALPPRAIQELCRSGLKTIFKKS